MARNNLWSNHRLYATVRKLSQADLEASRTSFFPSLVHTLNHILTVDWYYVDALTQGGRGVAVFDEEQPCKTSEALWTAQHAVDRQLVAFCEAQADDDLGRAVTLRAGTPSPTQERADAVLLHLFNHQTHHRGQVHAMLSGTAYKPPQLDEFFLDVDASNRSDDLRELELADAIRLA